MKVVLILEKIFCPVVHYFTWKLELVCELLRTIVSDLLSPELCELLSPETIFWISLAPDLFRLNFFEVFCNSNTFHTVSTYN